MKICAQVGFRYTKWLVFQVIDFMLVCECARTCAYFQAWERGIGAGRRAGSILMRVTRDSN